jgi:CDP-diacylglycerol--glycerol-3-phosphate 3-phosphatidyltransferase
LNLPNALTLVRIGLVPVMIMLLLGRDFGPFYAAAAVFCVAAATDAADGHIARSRNLITRFGQLADPVADKLLVGGALVTLVSVDRLAAWIAVVVLAREAGVSALRWYAGRRGTEIAVSSVGKLKTGMQMTSIAALMVVPDPSAAWLQAWLLGVVAVTVASGLDYLLGYARGGPAPAAAGAPSG